MSLAGGIVTLVAVASAVAVVSVPTTAGVAAAARTMAAPDPAISTSEGELFSGPVATAAPALKLSVAVGPPTTALTASGSGFPADDAISVAYWNTTVATVTASSTGTFTARFRIPVSAAPGPHTIQAFDSAGTVAMATFTVRTSWAMARFSPTGSGGRLLFSADTADLSPQPYPPAPPSIADGRVYVGDFSGGMRVFALVAEARFGAEASP
jgi:outer membrane protein assembly factor BamB